MRNQFIILSYNAAAAMIKMKMRKKNIRNIIF